MVAKKDLLKIIKVDNLYLSKYNVFMSGLVNIETLEPVNLRKYNKYYYYCQCCNKKKSFSNLKNFLSKKHEFGYFCQKCVTKQNTQKEAFKQKESEISKKRWKEGCYDHLKESGYFLEWGRRYCQNMLYKTEEEKAEIAAKKIKTWCSHSQAEKDEINNRRTKHFAEMRKMKNIKTSNFHLFQRRLATKEWGEIRMKVINRDKFTCQKCKKTMPKDKLQVHHIIPFRICKSDQIDNLITLCRKCHSKVERYIEYCCLNEDGSTVNVEKEMDFINENKE